MTKSKRQPKNFFRYFLDEFILFRRDFYYELDIPIETVKEKIKALQDVPEKTFERKIVVEFYARQGIWQFDLIAEQASKYGYFQNAKAVGSILDTGGKTILKGSVSLGGWFYRLAILSLIGMAAFWYWTGFTISFHGVWSIVSGLLIVFPIGFALYFWWRMYADRNHLYTLIEDVVKFLDYKARTDE